MRMVSFPEPVAPIAKIKPTNHERAEKTYKELQKRKTEKAKKLKTDIQGFCQDSFYKCSGMCHELRAYR